MGEPRRFRERPVLLVDLSEKVSEDLRIDTPRSLAPIPSLKAAAAPKAAGLRATSLAFAGLGSATALTLARTEKARRAVRKAPPALARSLRERLRTVVPGDGESVFTLTHPEMAPVAGETWKNYHECYFWLAAEHHIQSAIDEWMNSEYEWICEMLHDHDTDMEWGPDGHHLAPSLDQLMNAWDEVAAGDERQQFQVPLVRNEDQLEVEKVWVAASDLMDFFGLERTSIDPAVIIADVLLEKDLKAIENDEEILLDGYLVTSVDRGGDFTTIHLVPPQ